MLQQLLEQRELPELKSRQEMKQILLREEYGFLPDTAYTMQVSEPQCLESRLDCGRCELARLNMTFTSEYGTHTMPFYRLMHTDGIKRPLIVYMDFSSTAPSMYFPVEIIADGGVDVLAFCYTDATSDDADFSNGLAGVLLPDGQSEDTTCGKIAIWAFTAMRMLDYAQTLDAFDMENCAVLGHSRLGKTALVAGMLDERFKVVISNNSGCAGAALSKGNTGITKAPGKGGGTGETIRDIVAHFPFWFCKNFRKYTAQNYADDFDQHYLLACSAPRYVFVASSDLDDWADPVSEQLCCLAAGKYWEKEYGLPGFIHGDKLLEADECLPDGSVGYFRRSGHHFLSYRNWLEYIKFIKAKK